VNKSDMQNRIVFMRTSMLVLWFAKCFCRVNNFCIAECYVFACMAHASDQNTMLVVCPNLDLVTINVV